FRVMRGKSSPVLAGLLLGFTFLAHFIFGFIGALSLLVLSFLPNLLELRQRLARIAILAFIAFSIAAFQLVPMLQDGFLINHSRWEGQWKWDSFGASYVVKALLRGDLFDYGRLPVLSLLALVGAVACIVKMSTGAVRTSEPETPSETYRLLLCGAVLWLLLFCGRPAWGVLFTILHADQLQLHRLVGGFHAFGFFLMGIGLATLWHWLLNSKFRYRYTVAAGVTAAILFPVLKERSFFLQQNTEWSEANLAALNAEQEEINQTISAVWASPDRVFSGLAAAW